MTTSDYAQIEPRWIIVHSSQAEKRASLPLDKQVLFAVTANLKVFNTLCNKIFDSKKEAQQALQKFESSLLFTSVIESQVRAIPRYKKRGKPPKEAKPDYFVLKNRRLFSQFA